MFGLFLELDRGYQALERGVKLLEAMGQNPGPRQTLGHNKIGAAEVSTLRVSEWDQEERLSAQRLQK